jgi:hypothetical protein
LAARSIRGYKGGKAMMFWYCSCRHPNTAVVYKEDYETLEAKNMEMRRALEHAQNALMDYIPTIEKRGAALNYGRKVLGIINEALAYTPIKEGKHSA